MVWFSKLVLRFLYQIGTKEHVAVIDEPWCRGSHATGGEWWAPYFIYPNHFAVIDRKKVVYLRRSMIPQHSVMSHGAMKLFLAFFLVAALNTLLL
mmetsp:Transcript_46475/g.63285  ORF Transcript_46475/g.63285 Transcript_46475/m.63285 type:complete len:95 (+) Transcript_46475:22-306(+)